MIRRSRVSILEILPRLFTYVDVSQLINNPNVFLTRAVKAGHVIRLAKGYYFNSLFYKNEQPTIEEVACFVRRPTYISCEWAMNYHSLLLQVPFTCTAITLSPTFGERNKIHYADRMIEYSSINERLFFGFETSQGISIATPEKALLDAAYLRRYIPFGDELELDVIDSKKLDEMAKSFPGKVREMVISLIEEKIQS